MAEDTVTGIYSLWGEQNKQRCCIKGVCENVCAWTKSLHKQRSDSTHAEDATFTNEYKFKGAIIEEGCTFTYFDRIMNEWRPRVPTRAGRQTCVLELDNDSLFSVCQQCLWEFQKILRRAEETHNLSPTSLIHFQFWGKNKFKPQTESVQGSYWFILQVDEELEFSVVQY